MIDLTDKTAVVTGASRGLGLRVAMRLARHGAAVNLIGRTEQSVSETAAQIRAIGARVTVIVADLSRPSAFGILRDGVPKGGGVDILVNAAGVFGPIDLVHNTDPGAWIDTLMVNTVASYLTCRAYVPGMLAKGWGRIVNVTSAASLHPPGQANSAYGTSKAALNQFTRHLAAELRGKGVTANVIHPGDVKTRMWSDIRESVERLGAEADTYRQWAAWVERTGGDNPEKAADLVLDLMNDAAAEVTGEFLWIKDGLQSPLPSWSNSKELQPWRNR